MSNTTTNVLAVSAAEILRDLKLRAWSCWKLVQAQDETNGEAVHDARVQAEGFEAVIAKAEQPDLGIRGRYRNDLEILIQAAQIIERRGRQLKLPLDHEMRLVQLHQDLATEITCLSQDFACEVADDEVHRQAEDLD